MNDPVVLVVDDEKSLRDFVRRNLEARHYKVLTAANGLEAMATFNNEKVDLVILDLMMPHLDGLETTRRIRETSKTPIIILTALGEESDKVQAFDMGADDYLTKPFGVGELMGRIKAVLRRARWLPGPGRAQGPAARHAQLGPSSRMSEGGHSRDAVSEESRPARCGRRAPRPGSPGSTSGCRSSTRSCCSDPRCPAGC